jgi:hypothetical protein
MKSQNIAIKENGIAAKMNAARANAMRNT